MLGDKYCAIFFKPTTQSRGGVGFINDRGWILRLWGLLVRLFLGMGDYLRIVVEFGDSCLFLGVGVFCVRENFESVWWNRVFGV